MSSDEKAIEDVAREALELGPTATARPWAAVQPRSQDGGITVAHMGTCCADSFPTATSIRSLVAPGLLTTGQEQAARDAAFTVHACNHVEALARAVLDRVPREAVAELAEKMKVRARRHEDDARRLGEDGVEDDGKADAFGEAADMLRALLDRRTP